MEVHCEAFHAGQHLALQAGAGIGKTTTLAELARATRRRGRYLAHHRAIAVAGGYTRSDRAAELLGWTPKLFLEDGIRSALAWIPVRDELLKG
ncbi:Rossmann-fold NAD(P)-binding domain-containing protein [Streptomyces flaveolus]|uniref:hypothetical protein n=1 Tax=Streptomyces flaveolus TaxID=67297 RepID=UPI0036F93E35